MTRRLQWGDDWDVTREARPRRRKKGSAGPETALLPFADLEAEAQPESEPRSEAETEEQIESETSPCDEALTEDAPAPDHETMAKSKKKTARKKSARKTTRKMAEKSARKSTKKTSKAARKVSKAGTVQRKKPAVGKAAGAGRKATSSKVTTSGDASVSVRKRAYEAREVAEQAELPVDDSPPPGVGRQTSRGTKRTRASARGRGRKEPTVTAIDGAARAVYGKITKGAKPELKSPVRALSNVHYRKNVGYFELGRQRKVRTLTVNTVRTFAQSLRMMSLSKEMVIEDTFATKRDAYYQSKNWEDAKFNDQTESDTVMDDMEAMFSIEGVTREQLRFYPEEHGGAVAGELIVIDRDPVTGGTIEIDCTRFGSGAYTIPHSVEHLQFRTKAKFVLAIETGGMFQRLQYHAYPSRAKCVIVSMGGVPTRACRRFIRRLSDTCKIPVYAFVDCDPYGMSNIYRSLKVGSGNAAHINKFFCVPKAQFLGVTPDDIIKYKLPTHPLKDVDKTRARDALKNDPFFKTHKEWKKAVEQLLKMGVRAEQQALAKWGLNYVMDEYLPAKLRARKSFLP